MSNILNCRRLAAEGQALVETAIIAPVLIFMMIGVLEVGWALRGYLLLTSANREAARFAIRPGYLRYDEDSYQKIIGQAFNASANQLDLQRRGDFIITVIKVDTQLVCEKFQDEDCDCNDAVTNPYSPTIIISPMTHPTMTYKYPITSSRISQLDLPKVISESVTLNRRFNCQQMKKGFAPLADERVYVEMWYEQPQLFGFPLISNPYSDPVPMYAHTVMRKIQTRE